MIKAWHFLKPAWVRQQFELALALLPAGTALALQIGQKPLVELGGTGQALQEGAPGVYSCPLLVEAEPVGALLMGVPVGADAAQAQALGCLLCHALQGMLETEYARRAVARETLESYRELALLQRGVTDLNQSLNPASVVAALLKEFDVLNNTADFGAVFVGPDEGGGYRLDQSFGADATKAFGALANSRFFAVMTAHDLGDIANDLSVSALWAADVADFKSLLWQPLAAHGENTGLLVLASRQTEGFSAVDLKRAQTLSSVAATALRNAQLYVAEQKMFQSFVRVIATTIDTKSPYTAGHCRRVPEIALALAESAHRSNHSAFADFVLTEDDRNAIEIAAMLHDCGKVITPEWIIDKASKLDSIVNRIELLALRTEILRRDAVIDLYRTQSAQTGSTAAQTAFQARLQQLDDDFAFLEKCNLGTEFVTQDDLDHIHRIAQQHWTDASGKVHPMLTPDETGNLSVRRGTLNPNERKVIEDHAAHTINMLSQISFPSSLRNVTEYAGGHHERMNGSGYPNQLKSGQLSIPARIMAIADIFEALTAPDRPYRKPGTLSWAIDIMQRMKQDDHIDGDLFELFLSEKIYLSYAAKHLTVDQIDDVTVELCAADRRA